MCADACTELAGGVRRRHDRSVPIRLPFARFSVTLGFGGGAPIVPRRPSRGLHLAILSHRLEERDSGTVLFLDGEIDMSNSKDVRGIILRSLDRSASLSVDLSGINNMDSSGVAHLIEGLQRARSTNKTFRVSEVSDPVRMVLKIARLEAILMG